MSRRTARKQAFLNLYQSDVNDSPLGPTFERWREYRGDLEEYAIRLASGVKEEQQQLDAVLSDVAVNEAIELARGFSSEEAPSFVGGVLRGAELRMQRKVGHGERG